MRRLALTALVVVLATPTASAYREWPEHGWPPDGGVDERATASSRPIPDLDWQALEADVLAEMNLFRHDPRGYVAKLQSLRESMRGNLIVRPGETAIATQEGVSAVDEAIAVLSRAPRRLPRFARANGLAEAAREHTLDLGQSGGLGHDGSDGSTPDARVSRHGRWENMVAENIAFGPTTAEDVVVGLIVDDGVADRGHRDILLDGQLFFAGVACGPHPTYGATCVIDYASGFESRPVRKPVRIWRGNPGPR